jgi:general stress protein 26
MRTLLMILACQLISFQMAVCQDTLVRTDSEIELLQQAREIIQIAGNCSLITLDEAGLANVRIMDPFLPEDDFTIWFGTNPKSKKIDQIRQNPSVTLMYFNKEQAEYVVLHGLAEMVDDPVKKSIWWKPAWEAFYANKEEAYTLIKFTPSSLEISSYMRGILGDPETWTIPKIIF